MEARACAATAVVLAVAPHPKAPGSTAVRPLALWRVWDARCAARGTPELGAGAGERRPTRGQCGGPGYGGGHKETEGSEQCPGTQKKLFLVSFRGLGGGHHVITGEPLPTSPRDASEGKEPQRRPQKRLGRRLEEVAKAVGGGYCRLQMPLRLVLAVRGDSGWAQAGRPGGGGRWHANGTSRHIQHSPSTPTTGLRERGNDTSRSTGRSGRQNTATRRNMRREERVTVCKETTTRWNVTQGVGGYLLPFQCIPASPA